MSVAISARMPAAKRRNAISVGKSRVRAAGSATCGGRCTKPKAELRAAPPAGVRTCARLICALFPYRNRMQVSSQTAQKGAKSLQSKTNFKLKMYESEAGSRRLETLPTVAGRPRRPSHALASVVGSGVKMACAPASPRRRDSLGSRNTSGLATPRSESGDWARQENGADGGVAQRACRLQAPRSRAPAVPRNLGKTLGFPLSHGDILKLRQVGALRLDRCFLNHARRCLKY